MAEIENVLSETNLFPNQSLKHSFQEHEINGLKTFRHNLLKCGAAEAKAIQWALNTIGKEKCLSLGEQEEGPKSLLWGWSKQSGFQSLTSALDLTDLFPMKALRKSVSQAVRRKGWTPEGKSERGHRFQDNIYKSFLNGILPLRLAENCLLEKNESKNTA